MIEEHVHLHVNAGHVRLRGHRDAARDAHRVRHEARRILAAVLEAGDDVERDVARGRRRGRTCNRGARRVGSDRFARRRELERVVRRVGDLEDVRRAALRGRVGAGTVVQPVRWNSAPPGNRSWPSMRPPNLPPLPPVDGGSPVAQAGEVEHGLEVHGDGVDRHVDIRERLMALARDGDRHLGAGETIELRDAARRPSSARRLKRREPGDRLGTRRSACPSTRRTRGRGRARRTRRPKAHHDSRPASRCT